MLSETLAIRQLRRHTAQAVAPDPATQSGMSLWQELQLPVQLDNATAPAPTPTRPAGNGCMGFNVGRWDIAPEVHSVLERFRPQLEAMQSPGFWLTGLADPAWAIVEEHQVYSSSAMKLSCPVNACLRAVGSAVNLMPSRGLKSLSAADLTGQLLKEDGSYRYLPMEALHSTQERHGGAHLHNLLHQDASEEDKAKAKHVASQALMYAVLEGSPFVGIVSHTSCILLRRSLDPSCKEVCFTDTMPLDGTDPTIRQMLFTAAVLFEESIWLDPSLWPSTPQSMNWLAHAAAAADQPLVPDRAAFSAAAESEQGNDSRKEGVANGSNDQSSNSGTSPAYVGEHRMKSLPLMPRHSQLPQDLPELVDCPLPALHLGDLLAPATKYSMVRMGVWAGKSVVFKLWDTFQCPEARARLQQEWLAYHALKALQGQAVPNLEAVGSTWGGGMIFLVLDYAGCSLSGQVTMAQAECMRALVGQVHEQGVLHGDLLQHHFVILGDTIKLVDFDCAVLDATPRDIQEEFSHFSRMLPC